MRCGALIDAECMVIKLCTDACSGIDWYLASPFRTLHCIGDVSFLNSFPKFEVNYWANRVRINSNTKCTQEETKLKG